MLTGPTASPPRARRPVGASAAEVGGRGATEPRRRRRTRGDRGSSLLLVPAGVLIVFVLGGLAVDLSVTHLAQRELLDAAASAANDAAGAGVDTATLRTSGVVRLDPDRARTAAARSLEAQGLRGLLADQTLVEVDPATATVTVRVARRTDRVFAPALPGDDRTAVVRASASARAAAR